MQLGLHADDDRVLNAQEGSIELHDMSDSIYWVLHPPLHELDHAYIH